MTGPGMEGRESVEPLEHAVEGSRRGGFARAAALVVAVLAASLAIVTLLANAASEDVILSQTQASDAYNEFQANSLKQHISENDAQLLRLLAEGTPATAAAQRQAAQLERGVRDKYAPTKQRLLERARELEGDRDQAQSRHRRLQLSEAAFQLGIVLTSIALLTGIVLLVHCGAGLGVVGAGLAAAAYLLR